ncbi:MAG: hypothetical protein ACHQ50_07590 [Fimbriimonadales bacterium]
MVPLDEIIQHHPQYLAIVIISWVAIGVWVVSLVGWMIQGEVDGVFGVIGIGAAIVLGYFSFMPPSEALRPFTPLPVILTVVMFPILRKALNDRELLLIDVDAAENAYEILRLKPENHMMRFKLARLLYERGHVVSGLAIGEDALRSMPEKIFTDEHRLFGRWKRQNPQVSTAQVVRCNDCGHPNPASAITCEQCGHAHLLDVMRGRLVGPQFARKLIASWIAGIIALVGIPMASLLPPTAAIVAIVAIMAAAFLVIASAFRSKETLNKT